MVAPTVTAITPASGNSIGSTFVQITGSNFNLVALGSVRVFFDNQEAEDVKVITDSLIHCLTPRTVLDTLPADIEVRVENVTTQPDPNPPLVEPTVLAAGFRYRRPSIATDDDAKNGCVVKITQALVRDFRRFVLKNSHHDTHPEYADVESALVPEEKQSAAPSVKILGPQIQEDLFYREHGPLSVETSPGVYEIFDEAETVRLEYNYVCVGRSSAEAMNLWEQVTKYFQKTPDLVVAKDGVDPANGFVTYEQAVINEQRADVRTAATRHGVYQATGDFLLRGVPLLADKVGETREVTQEVIMEIEPLS